jgi:hypothetical protein
MELLSDDVVRSRLGFLREGREVDWPKLYPEPGAEAAEELSLSESVPPTRPDRARMRLRLNRTVTSCPVRSAGLPHYQSSKPRLPDRAGG